MNKQQPLIFFALFIAICLITCTKQATTSNSASTYIKVIVNSENLIAVTSFPLSDGNYMLIGKDPGNTNPGWMVKIDLNGNVLFQKSTSPLITILWTAIPLASGFAAAGYDATQTDNELHIILYDNNGNIVSSKIYYPGVNCTGYPLDMIPLSNGGYAISGSEWDRNNYPIPFLMITDNAFNDIYIKNYNPLNNEHNYCVSGLCQSPDGTINISGFFTLNNTDNAYMLRTYPNTLQKSFTWLEDSAVFETPGCMALNGNGNVIIACSRANIAADSGELVNYKNTGLDFVAGTLGINTLDGNGNFTGSVQYSGYPRNGFINSIKSTQDGGFILCGTVNQLNAINYSNTEIFVLKLDANLNKQWSNSYITQYPSFGVVGFQTTDGGYLISGYNFSFNKNANMTLIKTDASGNVN
jgi:hypothetical protein